MTKEEAARILDPETSREALLPYALDCQMRMAVVNEAGKVAAEELRKPDGDRVLKKAVEIAATVMQAAGLCRHESVESCKRGFVCEETCVRCIRSWLLAKAKKELRKGSKK